MPHGKDIITVGVAVPAEMREELVSRAASVPISLSNYCKIVLGEWLKSGKKLTLGEK